VSTTDAVPVNIQWTCGFPGHVHDNYEEAIQCPHQTRAAIVQARDLVKQVIDDEETGAGWGPDITMKQYLIKALEELEKVIEERDQVA